MLDIIRIALYGYHASSHGLNFDDITAPLVVSPFFTKPDRVPCDIGSGFGGPALPLFNDAYYV